MFSVTIDGKAGCGKSTLAEELSKILNLKKFNTGAVYRGITCAYKSIYGTTEPTKKIITEFIKNLNIKVEFDGDLQKILVNNVDYTPFLRNEEISNFVAKISPFDEIRQLVRNIQREFANKYDCIMEGRDIGSVVLKDSPCKLFITASNEVRAQRRLDQLKGTPDCPSFEILLKEINDRDYKDINREHGALLPAEDAIIIDNSNETLQQTISRCVEIINSIRNKK